MEQFKRYAIYYAPPEGAFADRAAAWLGGDAPVEGLAELTAAPRRYGFHGTIKPPFALAEGTDADGLRDALAGLAAGLPQVVMPGLALRRIGGFLALVPQGDATALGALAATVVQRLDRFRAPLTEADRARRRPERLTMRQRDLLESWGYPYVMEEFRFHLTLTGDLPDAVAETVLPVAQDWFAPVLPQPFCMAGLCLFAEAMDGRFHLLHRYALAG